MSKTKPLFVYWKLRGIGEAARLLLEYTGTEYDEIKYESDDHNLTEWLKDKPTLGLDFPNLPYYKEGDFSLTESWAIYRYIAGKNNLIPEDLKNKATCDMLQGVINDLYWSFLNMCYHSYKIGKNPNWDEVREEYKKNYLPSRLKNIEKFLNGKTYLTGEKLMYVDFVLFETIDQIQTLFPDIKDTYTNIANFMKTFLALEPIAKYRNSPKFEKSPIFHVVANWIG